jgi:hypothetical protein
VETVAPENPPVPEVAPPVSAPAEPIPTEIQNPVVVEEPSPGPVPPTLIPSPILEGNDSIVAPTVLPELAPSATQELLLAPADTVTAPLSLQTIELNLPFIAVGVLGDDSSEIVGTEDVPPLVPPVATRRFDFPLPTSIRGPNPPSITQSGSTPAVSTIIAATLGGALLVVGVIAVMVFAWKRRRSTDRTAENPSSEPVIVALPPLEPFHTHEVRDLLSELEQTGISALEIERIRQSILMPNEETVSLRDVEADGLEMQDILMPLVAEYENSLRRSYSSISSGDPFKRASDDISYPNSIV